MMVCDDKRAYDLILFYCRVGQRSTVSIMSFDQDFKGGV